MDITIFNRQRARRIDVRSLRDFLARLIVKLPPRRGDELTVCLVSDRTMRSYNRRFRGKDVSTDVLSFPASSEARPEGGHLLGDIVVSVPTAARQAREGSRSLSDELQALALHGYLHLLGYDHETDDGEMSRLERRLGRGFRKETNRR